MAGDERDLMRSWTLTCFSKAITNSYDMRKHIADSTGRIFDWKLTNSHAFALKDMQRDGIIRRIRKAEYELIDREAPLFPGR